MNAEWLLIVSAALVLTAGVSVYLIWRVPGASLAGWLPAGQLPAFTHTCGFILLSLAVTAPWPRLTVPVCAAWLLLECGFELLQMPAVAAAAGSTPWPGHALLAAHLGGVFDTKDLFASLLGACAALAITVVTRRLATEPRTHR